MTAPALAVDGIGKSFKGFRAVDRISFTVYAGELLALIGPNGAGKTTTFNMINGQLTPDHGRVLLEGRDVTGWPPRALWRSGVARTFQITQTFASMTVGENLLVAILSRERPRGFLAGVAAAYTDEIRTRLVEVDMAHATDTLCSVLAYGDLKRVELAIALVNDPRVLLMDEPTAGMAARERGALMRLVADRAHRRRTAVLFTEHDMDVVFGHADRVVVMNRGRLIAEGAPTNVRADPLVREVYLGGGTRPAADGSERGRTT
jgi:branched-chain amino acid transport system ATP-binding protein